MAPPTSAVAGSPGSFQPAGSDIPYTFTNLVALGPLGNSAVWTPGQSIVLGDTSRAYWGGIQWVKGSRPNEGVAGLPGVYRPATLTRSTVASLIAVLPDPPTPWPNGTWVPLTGAEQFAWWDGQKWAQGKSTYVASTASLWPPLPPDTGHTPQAIEILVAFPDITEAWGRAHWGVGRWGGWNFAAPVRMECDTEGLAVERGRTDPLAHVQAGVKKLTIKDPDRLWAPWVIPADGFRQWRTGVPIQVRTSAGYLFTGTVTAIQGREAAEPDAVRTVEVAAWDPLTFLATSNQLEQPAQGANELAGARLERIWNFAAVPAWVTHRFDPGVGRMQATTLAKAALTEMWLTADSDGGMVSCTSDGVVQYWDTQRGLTADRRVVPQVTFTDDEDYVAATPVVCTTKFDVEDDQAQVINWVAIAAAGGTQEVASNQTSISFYGRRTTQRNDLIHAEGQAWSRQIAEVFLSRVTRQSVVISPLVFDALRSDAAWAAAHTLDVGDRVAVHRSADGNRLDVEASIDQIRHDITPVSWITTINLAPGTQRTAYTRWGTARWGIDKWS